MNLCCCGRSTPQVVIAAAGFEADAATLKKVIRRQNVMYQHAHKKGMSVMATAQLVGNTLYYKRFFPYYSFTLVAGLDPQGAPLSCPPPLSNLFGGTHQPGEGPLLKSTRRWNSCLRRCKGFGFLHLQHCLGRHATCCEQLAVACVMI